METTIIIRSVNFAILLGFFISITISALISLRKRRLSYKVTIIWILTILFFPFLGAIAFWIVNPRNGSIEREILVRP
jgi:hypothetical protein